MTDVSAWTNKDDSGRQWRLDNSPGSGFADNGSFKNINWASGQTQITGSSFSNPHYRSWKSRVGLLL